MYLKKNLKRRLKVKRKISKEKLKPTKEKNSSQNLFWIFKRGSFRSTKGNISDFYQKI